MNKKILKIIGTICAFIYAFLIYYLYDKFPNFLTSIFSPVNNSVFQYLKVLFGSIILAGVTQKIIVTIKKDKINNICISNFVGALTSISIFIILFLISHYTNIQNNAITILITAICIIIAEIISYILMNKREFKYENKTIIFVIIVYIVFILLTYFPLKNLLFIAN